MSAVKNMNLPEIPRNINIGDINIKVPSLSPFWGGSQPAELPAAGWCTTDEAVPLHPAMLLTRRELFYYVYIVLYINI